MLKHPEHLRAAGRSIAEIDQFLDQFADAAEPVDIRFRWRPQLPDPNDEFVLEAAINGGAAALITHNTRDFIQAGAQFGIAVLQPSEALRRIGV